MAIGDRLLGRIRAMMPEGIDEVGALIVVWKEIGMDVAKIIDDWQEKGGIPIEIPLADGVIRARIPIKQD